jgi:hypothetical protein
MYRGGQYLGAEVEARRYLERGPLPDSARVVAEQLIAFSLVAQAQEAAAVDHFAAILAIDSSYSLDPFFTSPKILRAFEIAHQQFHAPEGGEDLPRVLPPPDAPPAPSFRLLLFPGWDQLHQGKGTKGIFLLGAGVACAASAITFGALQRSARDEYLAAGTPEEAAALYESYDRYTKAEYYSVAAFVLVYAYSAFDALLDLPPQLEAALRDTPSGLALSVRWSP